MAPKDDARPGDPKSVATNTRDSSLADKLDLDKNPIKFVQHDGSQSTQAHDKDYLELVLRRGKHSEFVQKVLRQRIERRAQEFPRWPASDSSGVRALWIESRFWYDRERLLPDFTEDWRQYRAKYLNSLELDPREPVHCPAYEKEFLNPIRRAYMKIGDFIEYKLIKPFVPGRWESATRRVQVTRFMMMYAAVVGVYYYARYNYVRWDKSQGVELAVSAPIVHQGDADFPFKDWRASNPSYHYEMDFTRRSIYPDIREFEDNSRPL